VVLFHPGAGTNPTCEWGEIIHHRPERRDAQADPLHGLRLGRRQQRSLFGATAWHLCTVQGKPLGNGQACYFRVVLVLE
jgi:hypothetical protein